MEKKPFVTLETLQEMLKTYSTPFICMMRGGFGKMQGS